jgi:hypothetical protein
MTKMRSAAARSFIANAHSVLIGAQPIRSASGGSALHAIIHRNPSQNKCAASFHLELVVATRYMEGEWYMTRALMQMRATRCSSHDDVGTQRQRKEQR